MKRQKIREFWSGLVSRVKQPGTPKTDRSKIGTFWVVAAAVWIVGVSCAVGWLDWLGGLLAFFGNAGCCCWFWWYVTKHSQMKLVDGTILDDHDPRYWQAVRFMVVLCLIFVNFCIFAIANYQPESGKGSTRPIIFPSFLRH